MDGQGFFVASGKDRCVDCGFCRNTLYCPDPQACIGCGVCAAGCPYEARELVPDDTPRTTVEITVDGQALSVPERITVKRALELTGLSFGVAWSEGDIPAPCGTGGCYSCLVLADGRPVRACVSSVRDGMAIQTTLPSEHVPLRVIHGPQGHAVGGKATPWWLKGERHYIEVAILGGGLQSFGLSLRTKPALSPVPELRHDV